MSGNKVIVDNDVDADFSPLSVGLLRVSRMGTGGERNGNTNAELRSELMQRCNALWEEVLCSVPSANSSQLWHEHQQIRVQLEHIAALQKELASADAEDRPMPGRKEALGRLVEWAERMGIQHEGVGVEGSQDGTGFGLQATKPIQTGTTLITVPRKAMLSWDLARKSLMLKKCFEKDMLVRTMDNVALALMVCCQKLMPDSSWLPYLDSLPTSFSTPLYFTADQIKELYPSPAYEESLIMYRNVARQFIYFLVAIQRSEECRNTKKTKPLPSVGVEPLFVNAPFTVCNFTFDLYAWAVACVTTRINMIPSQEARDSNGKPVSVPCLIPVLDMANHEFVGEDQPLTVHFSMEEEVACVTASKDYSPGEAVTIFYGNRTSRQFLLHNGFVPDGHNHHDTYKLKIGFPKGDRQMEGRVRLMRRVGFGGESRVYAFEVNASHHPVPPELIDFARVFLVDDPSNLSLAQLRSDSQLEHKAWKFLKDRFSLLQRAYGSQEQEQDADKEGVQLMISRLKRNELRIINHAEHFCAQQCQAAE